MQELFLIAYFCPLPILELATLMGCFMLQICGALGWLRIKYAKNSIASMLNYILQYIVLIYIEC